MSEKLSGDIPVPPEFNGDIQVWTKDIKVYLETVLRELNNDIQNLYDTKADVP